MQDKDLFDENGDSSEFQSGLSLDDGSGLRVVSAKFIKAEKFDWALFEGYDKLRVLTYSASVKTIVRMLDKYSFTNFECVFGYLGVLRDIKDILSFQKVVVGDTRAAIMGLKDDRHAHILGKVHEGQAHFYVLRKYIAHAKLYLLSKTEGETRVIIGSANLSERAFSGTQSETLVKFDNDEKAWRHYNQMFDKIIGDSSDEISLSEDRITFADIEILETPVMNETPSTMIIDSPVTEEIELAAPMQIARVEKVSASISPLISAAIPPIRGGNQRITQETRRDISRIRLVKTAEEANNPYFSFDRVNNSAILSGEVFPLESNFDSVKTDANLLLGFFKNYENAFEGDVPRMQRDYFMFMAWMYFSPFMGDLRSLALLRDTDIVRFPSFAIIYGKSNCGKTSLVDTLMTSMFNYTRTIPKASFTSSNLRALQQAYQRFPVVFDDIGRRAFVTHGREMIKNEMPPPVAETPGFIISMNAEPQSFPDDIVKRSMMIYTTTALPPHDEELRQRLQSKVQEIRHGLTTHLYRRYLEKMLDRLDDNTLPDDWLELSSSVLRGILEEVTEEPLPSWCKSANWFDYAEKRYDRVKTRLLSLLRPSAQIKYEGKFLNGWYIDGDRVIVLDQRDAYGRRGFDWENVPSTLIDEEASSGNRMMLNRQSLESFLGQHLGPARRWWKLWISS